MRLARRVYRFILVFCLLATVAGLGLAVDIWRYGEARDTAPANVAVVLGAAVLDDRPSLVLVERLRHAQALYQDGVVSHILVTGGRSPEDTLSEAEASRNWLEQHGVSADAIVLEDRSRTTIENIAFSKPIIAEAGLGRALIVSDPLHMRRALLIADRIGLEAGPSPTRTSRYQSWGTTLPFLGREVWFIGQYLLLGQ
jgi:uncharacterized SAM-binding protein YcdF (DUF218 family)